MILKVTDRMLQALEVRHLNFGQGSSGRKVVWWYGAVKKNARAQSLPHVVVWCRKLFSDGSLGDAFGIDVGITDLGLLSLGTIWDGNSCKQQLAFEEQTFSVNVSADRWSLTSQHEHYTQFRKPLIEPSAYPLKFGLRDRSRVLEFRTDCDRRLLIPCLEFYSRYYGRSGHVTRVLATYPWDDAECRLYAPFHYAETPGHWPIKLASSTYNADAVFLAHVKYDPFANQAARYIYSRLDKQYNELGGKAFLEATPWFQGPTTLLVQGVWLDERTFLGLRITGGSEPQGVEIDVHRENSGAAAEAAPEGAPISHWRGGRQLHPGEAGSIINLTADDEPGRKGDSVEILNPVFRIVGKRRDVVIHKLATAATRPDRTRLDSQTTQHSPGERRGVASNTGRASIHAENFLPSSGAVRDVWNGLLYFRRKHPEFILDLGWYSSAKQPFVRALGHEDPQLIALTPYDIRQAERLPLTTLKWVYRNAAQREPRGVLAAIVRTAEGTVFLFEIERRTINRTVEGAMRKVEEPFCGLVLVQPKNSPSSVWLPKVLDGIRDECGVMERVLKRCPPGSHFYRRSRSGSDEIIGRSTVVNALKKVGIDLLSLQEGSKPSDALKTRAD